MPPQEQGRFCDKCTKVVMDFSNMSNEGIISYLEKQKNEVCGRVRKDQSNITPSISDKLRKFLYAFALVFLPFSSFNSFGQTIKLEQNVDILNQTKFLDHDSGQQKKTSVALTDPILTGLNNIICVDTFSGDDEIKTSGGIDGTVKNANGMPIPFAAVNIIQAGKTIGKTKTNFKGNFLFKPLPIGVYTIEFVSYGFQKTQYIGIIVRSGRSTTVPPTALSKTSKLTKPFVIQGTHFEPNEDQEYYMTGGIIGAEKPTWIEYPNWIERLKKEIMWGND